MPLRLIGFHHISAKAFAPYLCKQTDRKKAHNPHCGAWRRFRFFQKSSSVYLNGPFGLTVLR